MASIHGLSRAQEKKVLAMLRGKKRGPKKGARKAKASGGARSRIGRGHCGINIGPARGHTKGLTCNGHDQSGCKQVGARMSKRLTGKVRVVCA